jgi:hypothetical protein
MYKASTAAWPARARVQSKNGQHTNQEAAHQAANLQQKYLQCMTDLNDRVQEQ